MYTTIGARLLTLPLIVKQQRNTANMTVSDLSVVNPSHYCLAIMLSSRRWAVEYDCKCHVQMARPEMMKLKDWYTEETAVGNQYIGPHRNDISSKWFAA